MKEEKKYLEGTRIEDLRGKKFGKLSVIDFDWERYERDKLKGHRGEIRAYRYYWICLCDCGTIKSVSSTKLKSEHTSSCGCIMSDAATQRCMVRAKEDNKTFYDWCINNNHSDYLDIWDYELNRCSPHDVSYASNKYFYFRCHNCNYSGDKYRLSHITTSNIKISCTKCNSFEQWCLDNNHQDYLDLWDYELNDKKPSEVSYGSSKMYYFRCSRGMHESKKKKISTYTSNVNNKIKCNDCNSFGLWLLDSYGDDAIKKYWSYKNKINPFEIAKCGIVKVWIKCENQAHDDYLVKCSDFYRGIRCSVCAMKTVVTGVNDVLTLIPTLSQYVHDIDSLMHLPKHSKQMVTVVCDSCGLERNIQLSTLVNRIENNKSICVCGAGMSYPERFLFCALRQIGINFKTQYIIHEKDGGLKRYDFYMCDYLAIIETNGMQHYEGGFGFCGGNSLDFEQRNDKLKRELALSNGIKHYIELDCRKSEMDWIKNSIMNSELHNLLNFKEEDIDWVMCDKFALSNYLRLACDKWNAGVSVCDISIELGVNEVTVRKYLNIGYKNGICTYNHVNETRIKSSNRMRAFNANKNKRRVRIVGTNEIFNSVGELLANHTCLNASKVYDVCNHNRKTHKGMKFEYID